MGRTKVGLDLSGKIAVVTGGSRGIGAACSKLLALSGAHVVLQYFQSEVSARSVEREILESGGSVELFKVDMANKPELVAFFDSLKKKYGRLDVLVNNAGVMKPGNLQLITDQDINEMVLVNMKSYLYSMQRASRIMMRQGGGKIVNISSILGRFGAAGQVAYSATKGAVIAMTLSAAKELGPHGIIVNAIAPGIIDTQMIAAIGPQERAAISTRIALGRIGVPDDVAKVVVFLSSDLADYVSGQVLGVDGCYAL